MKIELKNLLKEINSDLNNKSKKDNTDYLVYWNKRRIKSPEAIKLRLSLVD